MMSNHKWLNLDRKTGHKSVMYIRKFFMDRDELYHLVDQAIHDMEGIVDASDEGSNGMGQFFADSLLVGIAVAVLVSVYMRFIHG